ncbi:MAG: AIR synthase-related protein, partial [Candidatus Bipolaricaulia bacterium]
YAPILVELTGGFRGKPGAEITGIVHVTGGGLTNLERVLPERAGAILSDLFQPREEFARLQELGPVSEEEAYRTWNMGQPVLLVTPEPERVEEVLEGFEVSSRIVGEVTDRTGIVCQGKGLEEREFIL